MAELGSAETDRLRLERWRHPEHADALVRINADPEVVRFVGGAVTAAQSHEMSRRLAAHWDNYGYGLWAAVTKSSDAIVGFVGLSHPLSWPEMVERLEVGWRLARDAWGFGYATEAAREAVRLGREVLGRDELVSLIHPLNTRSLAVARRLGMQEEGEVPHPSRDETLKIMRLRVGVARQ